MFYAKGLQIFLTEGDFGILLPIQVKTTCERCASTIADTDVLQLEVCKGDQIYVTRELPWAQVKDAEGLFTLELTQQESKQLAQGVYVWRLKLLREGEFCNTLLRSTLEVTA